MVDIKVLKEIGVWFIFFGLMFAALHISWNIRQLAVVQKLIYRHLLKAMPDSRDDA